MSIDVQHISKSFGSFRALDDVSLKIASGELVALLGPSGSGKTTLLRVIAGLDAPDPHPGSAVRFDGEDVSTRHVAQRRIGFVFQHYALFRHMSVFENVAFGLRVQPRRDRLSREQIQERVDELLSLVQLQSFANRFPAQLSGGQRQRVALARALAVKPRILLLDEPFGALDAKVRQDLRQWLRRLHEQMHVTTVLVTHDQEEALEVADHVVIMNEGKIEQHGTPDELFHHARTQFVMEFLGQVNVFHGRAQAGVATAGPLQIECPAVDHSQELAVSVYLRPHELELRRTPAAPGCVAVVVDRVHSAGSIARIHVTPKGGRQPLLVEISQDEFSRLQLSPGDELFLKAKKARVFIAGEVAVAENPVGPRLSRVG